MSIVKRFNALKGLDKIDVLVDDFNTSRHIVISDMPESLPQGKSSFLIETGPFMKDGIELQIDFIDSSGNSIYTEPIQDYLEGTSRRISVEVYSDTAPGVANIVLVGELESIPTEPGLFSDVEAIPSEWDGIYNVRLTKEVIINPVAVNTQPIKFYTQPTVTATEKRLGTLVQTAVTGSISASMSDVEGRPAPNFAYISYNIEDPAQGTLAETDQRIIQSSGKTSRIYELGNTLQNRSGRRTNSIFSRVGHVARSASPIQYPYSIVSDSDYEFTTQDIGAKLVVTSVDQPASEEYAGAGAAAPPAFHVAGLSSHLPLTVSSFAHWTGSIVELQNNSVAYVDKPITLKNTAGEDIIIPLTGNLKLTKNVEPTSSYSLQNIISYADITLGNMRTFSGDVFKAKVLVRSEGSFDDFKTLADVPVESSELLIDPFSVGMGLRTGYFEGQANVTSYWDKFGGVNGLSTSATETVTYDNATLLDGIHLSGSISTFTNQLRFQTKDTYSFNLTAGVDYTISFNAYAKKGNDNSAIALLYISGSSVYQNSNPYIDPQTQNLITEPSQYGKRLGSLELINHTEKDYGLVTQTFTPNVNGTAVVQFRILAGSWYISDLSVKPSQDTGFSPSSFTFQKEMPAEFQHKRPDTFEFIVEFYDSNENIADSLAFSTGSVFTGANLVITGDDNTMSGDLFIGGDTTASGMHMGGVDSILPETGEEGALGSGFMRSVGYLGFASASDVSLGGRHGFMIYSGSVLPGSGENYSGVGLELVGASGSLKFRTSPSLFDVQADSFFVGKTTTQFISGSGQKIEISSSNFHLTDQGHITMSGDITANAGYIGDWKIIDGKLSGSNATLDAVGAALYHTQKGPGSDTSATFDQLRDEYYVDFTPNEGATANAGKYYVKFGPNFSVSSSGVLFASGAKFEGTITASAGQIGGWNIEKTYMRSNPDGVRLYGGGTPYVISSSNFQVTSDGDISGSQVLFTGGTIGGFELDSTTLSATSNNLILSSSGQITGSTVLFTGGKIGGFDIVGSSATTVDAISSADKSLILSGSGQITGSQVLFTGGKIAGYTISGDTLTATNFTLDAAGKSITLGNTATDDVFIVDADTGIQLGHNTFESAPFSVTKAGVLKAESGTIAGWDIDDVSMTGGDMVIRKDGTIESSGFASNVAGSGFRLTAASGGFLEVENARIRGTLSTAVFEKESVNAVGGQLYVANSTTLTGSAQNPGGFYSATEETMSVVNVTGFAVGEILSAKKVSQAGFGTEYFYVESSSRNDSSSDTDYSGQIYVTRGYGSGVSGDSGSLGDTPGSAQEYTGSQVIVSTGVTGSGYIRLNANPNDSTTPYIDIVERTGSGIYDVELKARLGDLSGLSSGLLYGETSPGFGLFTENIFLQGSITAKTGSFIGAVHVGTGGTMKFGQNVSSTNDGIFINTNNFWYDTGNFKVGDGTSFISSSGEIQTDKFELRTDRVKVSSTHASMSIGNAATLTSGTGAFLSGSGEFRFGDASSYIQFKDDSFSLTGADIDIDVTDLNISASGFTLSSPQASMSFGDSQEILLHATGGTGGVPIFKLAGGEISASNFFVDVGGNLTASNATFQGIISSSEANIGGWTIDDGTIFKGVTRLSSSVEPGLYIEDTYGNPMVTIAEKTMFQIGSDPDEAKNDSFEVTQSGQHTDGYHVGTTASPLTVTSWSFSSTGPVSHSITKRTTDAVFGGYNAAVLGDFTFDVIHPGQNPPISAFSRSLAEASASYSNGNTYELTQIVSASSAVGNLWKEGNVVSFAGVAKMSHSFAGAGVDRGFQPQKYRVDYWNGSAWKHFIPKITGSDGMGSYSVGGVYQSIGGAAALPANSHKLRVVLSGSINPDSSYTRQEYLYPEWWNAGSAGAAVPSNGAQFPELVTISEDPKYAYTELTFDNFRLRQSQPRVELSPDGFLLYQSDMSYIKMTADGLDIKGGSGNAAFGTTTVGSANSTNAGVFGSLSAPSLQAYTADTANVSATGYQGNVGEYAMGNHRHALEFSTINTLMSGQTISNGTWEGDTIAVAQGGTGATTLNNLITLGTHTTGNYVATAVAGAGIDVTGATGNVTISIGSTEVTNAMLAGSIANTKLATNPLARANHTGTQIASTISDFDTEVANNSAVTANTAKVTNVTTNLSVSRDGTKLDVVSSDGTNAVLPLADTTNWGVMSDEMFDKLDAIEASATADQSNTEIRTAVEAATDSNVFTDADHSKLNAIEASATADQSNAEIRTAVEAASDSNVFTDTDHTKLNAIEALADVTDTANVTSAGALMDSELAGIAAIKATTGTFLTADQTKLDTIETSATADQTAAEIRTAVEAATDSNVFTDGDHTKLNAIEASADVTDTTNVTAAGALMDSELTSIADVKALNQSVVSGATPTFTTTNFTDASNKRLMTDAQETLLDSVETNADVTDATNVEAAGALMDSEVDADIKTLSLPASTSISTFGASLIDDAAATNARTTLGLIIGTDVQAFDDQLASVAGWTAAQTTTIGNIGTITTAADKMIYTTAADTFAETALTSTARTLLDDASTTAMRTTLGVNNAYQGVGFASSTGILTMTEIDGGTDTVDLGIGTADSPTFVGLTLTGDLSVAGTMTTTTTNEVVLGDQILTLNGGSSAGDGGIYVNDAATAQTGSLLWDVAVDRWKGGLKSGEVNLVTISSEDTLTNKTLTSPDINTPDIDGGNIDGATIATSDITVGSGKTLNVSAGTLTLANNQISGDKVEGGTIAATTITALTTAGITATANIDIGNYDFRANTLFADDLTSGRVVFTTTNGQLTHDSDITFSGDTLTVTKIGAYEQAGAVNFSDEQMTNVNIDSGTITGITDLLVADGGTGAGTLTDHGVLVGSGTDPITPLSVGTNGQVLVGSTGADPVFATITFDDGLTATTGAGTLEVDLDLKANGGLVIESNKLALDLGASSITNTLGVGDGGTGLSTVATDNILTGNGAGALTAEANLTFDGSSLTLGDTGTFGTSTFTSALVGGDGFRIDDGGSDGTTMEIDNIVVRNTLRTHIFQKDVVKATNGYLYVSDSAVISSIPSTTTLKMRDDKSAIFTSFPVTMWCKEADSTDGTITSVIFTIDSLDSSGGSGDTAYHTYDVTYSVGASTDLQIGMTCVRTSGGSVLIDASSANSPFVDVLEEVDSSPTVVARMGNLAGITDTDFSVSPLVGHGLYTSNIYLKGNIAVKSDNALALVNSTIMIGNITGAANSALKLTNTETASTSGLFGYDSSGVEVIRLRLDGNHQLAGWDIVPGKLQYDDADGSIALDATNQQISVHTGSINTAKPKVVMGKLPRVGGDTDDDRYGFAVFSGTDDASILDDTTYSVLITKDQARLAGWDLIPGNIQSDNTGGSVRLSSVSQSLTIWTGSMDEAQPKLVLGKLPLHDGTVDSPYGFAVFSGEGTVSGSEASASVLITANKARLAGWELVPGKLTSGTVARIDGNAATIALGTNATTHTSATPQPSLFFVSASADPIFFVGENFSYVSDVLTAGGWKIGNGQISSSNGNAILSGSGVLSLGSGTHGYGEANRTYIDGPGNRMSIGEYFTYTGGTLTAGGWTIGDGVITGGNVTLTAAGSIKVGNLLNASGTGTTRKGFFADNDGNVLIKADENDNNYIKFDGTGGTSALQIKTDNFSVVSGNVTMTGTVTATAGAIGGWTIGNNLISSSYGPDTSGITINANYKNIIIHGVDGKDNINSTGIDNVRVIMGQVSSGSYGIKGFDGSENRLFELSETRNEIAGWIIGSSQLYNGRSALATGTGIYIGTDGIVLGGTANPAEIKFLADGSGHLAAGNIAWDTSGNTSFGDVSYENVYIANNGVLQFRDGTTVYGELNNTTWTIGNASAAKQVISSTTTTFYDGDGSTERLVISNDGTIVLKDSGGVTKVSATTSGVRVTGADTSDYVDVVADAINVVAAGDNVASFGATTTVGITGDNEYVKINGDGVKIYGGSANDYAFMDANSLDIYTGGAVSASFGTTTTIGPVSMEHVSITSGSFSIKGGAKTYLSASAAGLEMSGKVKATSGEIGGWTIDASQISSSTGNTRIISDGGGAFSLGPTVAQPTSHTTGRGVWISGSGEILIGNSEGERIQMTFAESAAGKLIMSSSNFYLGSSDQYISGSGGNIEISSSAFHLDTVNNTMKMSGSITATGGTIGGFTINSSSLFSDYNLTHPTLGVTSTGSIRVTTSDVGLGPIFAITSVSSSHATSGSGLRIGTKSTAGYSAVNLTMGQTYEPGGVNLVNHGGLTIDAINYYGGAGVASDQQLSIITDNATYNSNPTSANTTSGFRYTQHTTDGVQFQIGKADGAHLKFSSADNLLYVSSSNFFLGGAGQFVSGSNGNIEISSSAFHLDTVNNTMKMSGSITATDGTIGGFNINSSSLFTGDLLHPSLNVTSSFSLTPMSNLNSSRLLMMSKKAVGWAAGFDLSTKASSVASKTQFIMGPSTDGISPVSNGGILISSETGSIYPVGRTLMMIGGIQYGDAAGHGMVIEVSGSGHTMNTTGFSRIQIGNTSGAHLQFSSKTNRMYISSSNFFLGGGGQFVSGSNGNIEISSSAFHLDTVNNTMKMSGSITATDGNIGGFELAQTQINSTNDNLILKSSGQITGSNVLFDGGKIGGFEISDGAISSSTSVLIIDSVLDNGRGAIMGGSALANHPKSSIPGAGKSGFFMGSTGFFFGDADKGFISYVSSGGTTGMTVSGSNFSLDTSGNVSMEGTVTATAGAIGGFTLANNQLTGSSGAIISTAADGTRVKISGTDNTIKFYAGDMADPLVDVGLVQITDFGSANILYKYGMDLVGGRISSKVVSGALIRITNNNIVPGGGVIADAYQPQFANIQSYVDIETDTQAARGRPSIYGEFKSTLASDSSTDGLISGVTGRIIETTSGYWDMSAGVVGISSADAMASEGGGVPDGQYGVVSIGNAYVKGALVVDGKVGIGTSSPKNKLQVDHTGADGNSGLMIVRSDTSTLSGNWLGGIGFDSTDGNVPSDIDEASAYIGAVASQNHSAGNKGGHLVFGTAALYEDDDLVSNEVGRWTDGGNLLIGRTTEAATSKDPKLEIDGYISFDGFLSRDGTAGSDNRNNIFNLYWDGSAATMYVDITALTPTFSASDYRIKENVINISGSFNNGILNRINTLRPIQYTQKSCSIFTQNDNVRPSFIAHEVQEQFPDIVKGTKDEVDDDGNIVIQQFDIPGLTTYLVKAVQELTQAHNHLIAAITGSTDLNHLKASVTGSLIG